MQTLRRYLIPGATYFITCVTYNREPLLLRDPAMFWDAWSGQPLLAWVVLPDHLHVILTPDDGSISKVMHRFKVRYSRAIRGHYRPGPVWQKRFWDRVIRDQEDMNRHTDYIHYNPVRHGFALEPLQWELSSMAAYLEQGLYPSDWGTREEPCFEGEYGE